MPTENVVIEVSMREAAGAVLCPSAQSQQPRLLGEAELFGEPAVGEAEGVFGGRVAGGVVVEADGVLAAVEVVDLLRRLDVLPGGGAVGLAADEEERAESLCLSRWQPMGKRTLCPFRRS
jgi:hypothetical protein